MNSIEFLLLNNPNSFIATWYYHPKFHLNFDFWFFPGSWVNFFGNIGKPLLASVRYFSLSLSLSLTVFVKVNYLLVPDVIRQPTMAFKSVKSNLS